MTVLDERVAEVVREEQPATAVLASTSWRLRSTSGDGVDVERVIAIAAQESSRHAGAMWSQMSAPALCMCE